MLFGTAVQTQKVVAAGFALGLRQRTTLAGEAVGG